MVLLIAAQGKVWESLVGSVSLVGGAPPVSGGPPVGPLRRDLLQQHCADKRHSSNTVGGGRW